MLNAEGKKGRMMTTVEDRRRAFLQLHESGCFVMPNPWDAGSARVLARLRFPALATTSAGFAWSVGRADNHVTIDQAGAQVLLTGRSEGFIAGRPDLHETIRRLTAYAEAGAECLFAPGIRTRADIQAVVNAVSPKPVNVVVGSDFTTVAELADMGVRRISVGGALARTAWSGFLQAATEIAERGSFSGLAPATLSADINGFFG